jgi:hypothetical protein
LVTVSVRRKILGKPINRRVRYVDIISTMYNNLSIVKKMLGRLVITSELGVFIFNFLRSKFHLFIFSSTGF